MNNERQEMSAELRKTRNERWVTKDIKIKVYFWNRRERRPSEKKFLFCFCGAHSEILISKT